MVHPFTRKVITTSTVNRFCSGLIQTAEALNFGVMCREWICRQSTTSNGKMPEAHLPEMLRLFTLKQTVVASFCLFPDTSEISKHQRFNC